MSKTARLLLVEDDPSLGETLQERLDREGYEVRWVGTQAEAEEAWRAGPAFDLIVLDVGLPDGNGFDFARQVAAESSTPFIFVTAMNGAEARLEGYEIGAEEFIPKPFHLKELLLRVKHVLSTHAPGAAAGAQAGGLPGAGGSDASGAPARLDVGGGTTVEFDSRRVLQADGRSEFLPAKEFEILRLLVERSPAVLSRDEILDAVWGEDRYPSHRTVDNAIVRLRQTLGEEGGKRIRSVRGVGYQWI